MLAATTIFLFAILSGPVGDRPTVTVLFKTTSLTTCQAQADAWNKAQATHKLTAVCLTHAQKALVAGTDTYEGE